MNQVNAEVFVTIARLGSYRKAADKLGYTHAGISYIVKVMEEYTGFRLFTREFGGVRLTPEGEQLLPYMQQILDDEKSLGEQVSRISGLQTGHIRLISFNTVIVCWIPDILRGFKEKYPMIEIELFSCDAPARGIQMIQSGEADCGFLATDKADGIDIFHIRTEPDVAVVSLDHPMANAKVFPIAKMEKYPMIGSPLDEAPFIYEKARKKGIHFNQIVSVDNDYGNLTMISQNLGFGIFPKMIVDYGNFPVKAIPIDDGSVTPISIGLRSYENGSLAAKAFVDYVLSLGLDKN